MYVLGVLPNRQTKYWALLPPIFESLSTNKNSADELQCWREVHAWPLLELKVMWPIMDLELKIAWSLLELYSR